MASVITAIDPVTAMLTLGGFRDNKNMVAALAAAAGLSFETISGGGTVAGGKAAIVLDGQTVTLTDAPANGTVLLIVASSANAPVQVNAGAGDTIGGNASTVVGDRAMIFTYATSGTNWTQAL